MCLTLVNHNSSTHFKKTLRAGTSEYSYTRKVTEISNFYKAVAIKMYHNACARSVLTQKKGSLCINEMLVSEKPKLKITNSATYKFTKIY